MPPPLTAEEKATVGLFQRSTPAVVFITNIATRRDAFTLDPVSLPQGAGSGFVWDRSGHIVTNYHVIKVRTLPRPPPCARPAGSRFA